MIKRTISEILAQLALYQTKQMDLLELKEFANKKLNEVKMINFHLIAFNNIVGERENT